MPDLRVADLTVEYSSGGYVARPLDGLTIDAPAGSLTLLMGPSGCGKTTLLSCLGAMQTPTAGSIRFGDLDITGLSGAATTRFRQRTVGFVFQGFNLVSSLTVRENVTVPMRAARLPHREARPRADALLERAGLAGRGTDRPGDLSGGQQQRVAIARALALDPPLILADEPTAHLDYIQVEDVIRLIRDLATDERIVVVATHDHRLLPLADQVVELSRDFGASTRPPERTRLGAGEVVFRQGSVGDLVYLIDTGQIEIFRERTDGGEDPVVTYGPGHYFGEMGAICGLPRSATARATTDTVVVGYTVRDFRHRVGIDGGLGHRTDDRTPGP
jgi:putative ABC transport system ATP-binding protein